MGLAGRAESTTPDRHLQIKFKVRMLVHGGQCIYILVSFSKLEIWIARDEAELKTLPGVNLPFTRHTIL